MVWVADLTYIRIATAFCYLAVILDACSRKVVGYAISRRIDTPLALAALQSALENRRPSAGCIHHTDRGCQGGFKWLSQHLENGDCDDHSKATFKQIWASPIAFAGPAAGGST